MSPTYILPSLNGKGIGDMKAYWSSLFGLVSVTNPRALEVAKTSPESFLCRQ